MWKTTSAPSKAAITGHIVKQNEECPEFAKTNKIITNSCNIVC